MTDNTNICLRCWVSGKVQGVWYRAATQEQARRLRVTGHARNLADGRVEVLACGERAAVEQLQSWLWQGPPAARVSAVDSREEAFREGRDFTTG